MPWALIFALAASAQQAWPSHAREAPPQAPRVVAVVNGTALLSDRLEAAVQALLPYESFHRNVSAEKLDDVRQRALIQIVNDELQYQDAVSRGVAVTDTAVDRAVADAAARYPNRKAFTAALARAGAAPADFRREVRRALTIRKAFEQQVTARCSVGRAEAREYYARNPERFVEPERLHVQAITVGVDPSAGPNGWTAGRAKADDVLRQLNAGAGFDELARKYSTDPAAAKGGDMGLLHRGSLSQAFEAAAATLEVGEPSPVVETIYGYHIIRIVEILPSRSRSFEDVSARLQQDLTSERCTSVKDSWLAALRASARVTYPR